MAWDDSATRWAVCWAHLAVLLTTPQPPAPSTHELRFILQVATALDFPPGGSHSHHGSGLPAWEVTLTPRPRTSRLGGHTHTTAPDFQPGRSRSHQGPGLPAWGVTLTPRPCAVHQPASPARPRVGGGVPPSSFLQERGSQSTVGSLGLTCHWIRTDEVVRGVTDTERGGSPGTGSKREAAGVRH